jgi:hypothetical protein
MTLALTVSGYNMIAGFVEKYWTSCFKKRSEFLHLLTTIILKKDPTP